MHKNNRLALVILTATIMLSCACPVSGILPFGYKPSDPTPSSIPFGEKSLGLTPGLPTFPTIPATQPVFTNPTQIKQPTSVPIDTDNIIYSDNFSVESLEFKSFTDENGYIETRDGAFVVRSTNNVWNWGNSESEFEDVVIDFDAILVKGPTNFNAGIGVICRLTGREDDSIDGYMLAISSDGYYSISVAEAGTLNPIVNWTSTNKILTGKVTNHIRATCNGSRLSLEANGQLLATTTATNNNLTMGSVAFAAISYEEAEPVAEVHFDNLIISSP